MKCKCDNAEMTLLCVEKDYGDTIGKTFWCDECGRAAVEDIPIRNEPNTVQWHKPKITITADIKKRLDREMANVEPCGYDRDIDLLKEKGAR